MSRLTLLAIYMVWMSWSKKAFGAADPIAFLPPLPALVLFAFGYVLLAVALRAWASWAAGRDQPSQFRYQDALYWARLFVPAWLGVGVYVLHWGPAVEWLTRRLYAWPTAELHVEIPQLILGTLPAVLTWVALWWAEYPVTLALREQGVLSSVEDERPVYRPPTLVQHVSANFRLQVMFTLVPVLILVLVRDLAAVVLGLAGVRDARGLENVAILPAMLGVFLLAPEILRRVLHTERFPESPLRRRLEAMSRRAKLRHRDILLWRTESTMANAAVMGLVPRLRYVLLSDLLLESMTDEQIEAVFAHELGHVVHKHLLWFGLYAILTMLFFAGPGDLALGHLKTLYVAHVKVPDWETLEGLIVLVLALGSFLLAYGILSPRFERQADVYAARTLQAELAPTEAAAAAPTFVGEHGAGLFAAALHRVAVLNHMPIYARNLSHGSIDERARALYAMSADPSFTRRFDRSMRWVYGVLLASLAAMVVWICAVNVATGPATSGGTVAAPPAIRTAQ